ncbi:MAG: TetR/AcrR family transcriptional regulator [Rhodovulum sulfidophilum]|uniref:TetR/AcrR family transcriptional regulator n=1 Tax=Rhodovulum sulfidophilum TaxID=35806 RepID=A0A2W5N207_RHOSU|nr:MAG: TetR/AcrR family transcriptional regulator [Rhodovulum sulfidophilum]
MTQPEPRAVVETDAPDSRRETNPRKELVREQLIDVAARLFDEQGYDRCSMATIANAMGLGRSAIYHYFRSKEEILAAIIEAEALAPSNRLAAMSIDPDGSAGELLRQTVIEGVVRRLSSGARFVRLSRLEAQIPEHLRRSYDVSRRAIYDHYVRCIDHGIATGEFRELDSHVAAFGVIGMANWTSRWFKPEGRMSAQEVAEVIADMALASLRTTGAQDRLLEEARARARVLAEQAQGLSNLLG